MTNLYDADTAEVIGSATETQIKASNQAAERNHRHHPDRRRRDAGWTGSTLAGDWQRNNDGGWVLCGLFVMDGRTEQDRDPLNQEPR